MLRLPLGDTEPGKLKTVSLPPVGRAAKAAAERRIPVRLRRLGLPPPGQVRKLPPKQLVKKPTRKRQQQEEAFSTLPGNSVVAMPFDGGATFAVGKVLGRPITVDGHFARNFQVAEIVDRSAFDYPALLQDPRLFFPIPAP